ncbi:PA2779 family protein [Ruegeria sp. 2205SS24-7]|uniref:PA2779 family protein n=1 Tax=Ruegeria discodermiae TaxID=3064389 RepID=UPI002741BEE9|nr:PA2779 family protein [Ruegeria sp. 2205SS24-7]MDP5220048.1 PA2779 family protein [Ruegeria sp. 2205SS24-7]
MAGFLAAQMLLAAQTTTMVQAELLTTEAAISKYAAIADRDYLLGELKKKEIRDEIIAQGVDPGEAEARLSALSDVEIASIVEQMEEGTAGGNAVVGALLTVFVILLVTDLLCLTKVFSFTRCATR